MMYHTGIWSLGSRNATVVPILVMVVLEQSMLLIHITTDLIALLTLFPLLDHIVTEPRMWMIMEISQVLVPLRSS